MLCHGLAPGVDWVSVRSWKAAMIGRGRRIPISSHGSARLSRAVWRSLKKGEPKPRRALKSLCLPRAAELRAGQHLCLLSGEALPFPVLSSAKPRFIQDLFRFKALQSFLSYVRKMGRTENYGQLRTVWPPRQQKRIRPAEDRHRAGPTSSDGKFKSLPHCPSRSWLSRPFSLHFPWI